LECFRSDPVFNHSHSNITWSTKKPDKYRFHIWSVRGAGDLHLRNMTALSMRRAVQTILRQGSNTENATEKATEKPDIRRRRTQTQDQSVAERVYAVKTNQKQRVHAAKQIRSREFTQQNKSEATQSKRSSSSKKATENPDTRRRGTQDQSVAAAYHHAKGQPRRTRDQSEAAAYHYVKGQTQDQSETAYHYAKGPKKNPP